MDKKELVALERELMDYVAEVGEGKHFEILSLEIRTKLDVLNKQIAEAVDNDSDDLSVLIHVAYHYYQLMYG